MLVRLNIKSTQEFVWLKQSMFYFKQEEEITSIVITDVLLSIKWIYRMSREIDHEPLTDRCYITLDQALGMCMSGFSMVKLKHSKIWIQL